MTGGGLGRGDDGSGAGGAAGATPDVTAEVTPSPTGGVADDGRAGLDDYRALYSSLVSDALDELGRSDCVMAPGLARVAGDGLTPTVGWAYPIEYRCTNEWVEVDRLLESIDSVPPHSVVVVAGDGDPGAALWGGLCSAGVLRRRGVGAVVDGAVRDVQQIAELGFPVYASHRSPRDIRSRGEVVAHGRPVRCRGVLVRPGDLVFADANGVVVVPSELEATVRAACLDRMRREAGATEALRGGTAARDVFDRYQVF
ncbi:MAG TPA: hypothetical protein VIL48_10640 [Acidimicrobiales bacterium]